MARPVLGSQRLGPMLGATMAGMAAAWWMLEHRRSRTVQAWHASEHRTTKSGPLAAKAFGQGRHTVLMLHGLGATSEFWGAAYDQLGDGHRVLVPDLLGFGGSLDEERSDFGLPHHLAALDRLVAEQAPDSDRITVIAHSMGSAVALAWAARHHRQVDQVICVGAPMFATEEDALEAIARTAPMARLFLLDTTWAERACALSCAHRTLAGLVAAVIEPQVPVAMARRSPLHTWPAYRDAMQDLILRAPWQMLLSDLVDLDVAVKMIWGDGDPIGDRPFARSVLGPSGEQVAIVPGAEHHLPITHARNVIDLI